MAKKSKSLLARIKAWFLLPEKPEPFVEPERKIIREPRDFSHEYQNARKAWDSLILTRKVSSGVIFESESIRVNKTNDQIFKVDGSDFSLLVVTESSIYQGKDEKWNGILLSKEGILNESLKADLPNLEAFLIALGKSEVKNLISETNKKQKESQIQKIHSWPIFWKEQLILGFSANTLALVVLSLGDEMKNFIQEFATEKQQMLIRDELYYLSLATNQDLAKQGKNRNFFDFSIALDEFYLGIDKVERKRELEMQIEDRKKRKRAK